jgi:hypothetical protein
MIKRHQCGLTVEKYAQVTPTKVFHNCKMKKFISEVCTVCNCMDTVHMYQLILYSTVTNMTCRIMKLNAVQYGVLSIYRMYCCTDHACTTVKKDYKR